LAQLTVEVSIVAKNREKSPTTRLWIFRSFKVIDVDTPGKLVSSACCYKQQVCVYPQPFSRTLAEITHFE